MESNARSTDKKVGKYVNDSNNYLSNFYISHVERDFQTTKIALVDETKSYFLYLTMVMKSNEKMEN